MSAGPDAERIRERNRRLFGSRFGAIYDFYISREPVGRVVARAVWGSDIRPYYASLSEIGATPDGSTIIDAPCGSGVALRALRPEQPVRYLGFDLSPEMLRRARRRARRLGLERVELATADAEAIPVDDRGADLSSPTGAFTASPTPRRRCARPRAVCARAAGWSGARSSAAIGRWIACAFGPTLARSAGSATSRTCAGGWRQRASSGSTSSGTGCSRSSGHEHPNKDGPPGLREGEDPAGLLAHAQEL
jgi:hypothetical protein